MVAAVRGARSSVIVLTCVALVAGLALPRAWAETVDPQSLVGEWVGTWSAANRPSTVGQYIMTITKVAGNQVYGRVEQTGGSGAEGAARSFDFVGTFEGDRLVFIGSERKTELTIIAIQSRGSFLGINCINRRTRTWVSISSPCLGNQLVATGTSTSKDGN